MMIIQVSLNNRKWTIQAHILASNNCNSFHSQHYLTENEQTCGLSLYHRPCLSFGLSWLVLPIIWSVHQLLEPRTLIPVPNDVRTMKSAFSLDFWSDIVISLIFLVSSMWNHPTYRKVSSVGQHHWLVHCRHVLWYILYGRYPLVPYPHRLWSILAYGRVLLYIPWLP